MRCGSLPQSEAAKWINWPTGIFSGGGSCGTKPMLPSTVVRSRARRMALDGDRAVVGVFTEQAANQRGLAGTVGTDQGDTLAEPDLEVDAVEHAGAAEGLGDVLE